AAGARRAGARFLRLGTVRPRNRTRAGVLASLDRPIRSPGATGRAGGPGVSAMKRVLSIAAAFSVAALGALGSVPALAQAKPGVERLYILNCGEGTAGDISRWSPGVNEGKSMPFVDNCYLIKHAQGWMLWDTGLTDAIGAMPYGPAPCAPQAAR